MPLAQNSGCELQAGLLELEFSSYLEGPPVAKIISAINKGHQSQDCNKDRRVVPSLFGKSCRVWFPHFAPWRCVYINEAKTESQLEGWWRYLHDKRILHEIKERQVWTPLNDNSPYFFLKKILLNWEGGDMQISRTSVKPNRVHLSLLYLTPHWCFFLPVKAS